MAEAHQRWLTGHKPRPDGARALGAASLSKTVLERKRQGVWNSGKFWLWQHGMARHLASIIILEALEVVALALGRRPHGLFDELLGQDRAALVFAVLCAALAFAVAVAGVAEGIGLELCARAQGNV